MKIGDSSMSRVRSIVSASCAGRSTNPGATTVGTSHGAATHITAEKPTRRSRTAFITLDATCHASSSRSRAR